MDGGFKIAVEIRSLVQTLWKSKKEMGAWCDRVHPQIQHIIILHVCAQVFIERQKTVSIPRFYEVRETGDRGCSLLEISNANTYDVYFISVCYLRIAYCFISLIRTIEN